MIHPPLPEDLSYLEPLSEDEIFYMKYHEAKADAGKKQKLLAETKNIRKYIIPEVYEDVAAFDVRTLFDDHYKHDITVRKHVRYSPDLLHEHTYFEMIYVLKGQTDNTIEGRLYQMNGGDICILPPNVYHKLWVGDDSIIINIIIKKAFCTEPLLSFTPEGSGLIRFIKQHLYTKPLAEKKFLMYHAADSTAICGIMTFLIAEALKGQNSPYVKNALLISLFNLLIQKSSGAEEIKESEKGETAVKILEYLQEHYTTVTLTDAAKYFNYSVPYLSKLIQDLTGDSFIKILQRIKLKEACHLLATTDCRISEIPALVGYDNAVYFNRIFKQKIGTSPYRYRKIHKNTLINGPYTEGSLL